MTDVTPEPIVDDTEATVQVETLFSLAMEAHNLYVEEHFDTLQDINPQDPLLQLRSQALISPEDSFLEVITRFWAFYVLVGKAAMFAPPVYGVPVDYYDQNVTYKPQVTLHFVEPYAEVEPTYQPVKARISFRIMKTPVAEITEAWARSLATEIKEVFALERFSFRKGQLLVTYKDPDKGYDFQLYVFSEAEALKVIEAVLPLQGDAFDETKIVVHTSSAAFPAVPPETFLYGKERRAPRKRPVATVQFTKAELKLHGLPRDIVLIDVTGRGRTPLVT
jgi:hypothetical protein